MKIIEIAHACLLVLSTAGKRMGEERLTTLVQESPAAAVRTGAAKPTDFAKVIVDTTVQEKAITFPTDAKLMPKARERLVRLAKAKGVDLRQSYARIGKRALIQHRRYSHAKRSAPSGADQRSSRSSAISKTNTE